MSDNYNLDDWLRNASEDTRRLNTKPTGQKVGGVDIIADDTLPDDAWEIRPATAEDQLGALIAGVLNTAGLDPATLEREYKFHRTRGWRFDYALPGRMLAFELEGGIWSGGRHVRGKGYEADAEKYNEAALDGWRVLRFTSAMVRDGRALATVQAAIAEAS